MRFDNRWTIALVLAAMPCSVASDDAVAQEERDAGGALEEEQTGEPAQSRESMANDSTASQWSYQLAWQGNEWRDDTLENGQTRPEGNKNFWQLRIVAPIAITPGLKMLPRLTLRNVEAVNGTSGSGNAELFALFVPVDWGTGRWGIGPQINFPADDEQFGTSAWRFGFATAALQRAANDKILYGVLVQQVWGETDPAAPDDIEASPITIQPVFNYALPHKLYLNIGETALSYDWQAQAWLVPLGIRFGKLIVQKSGTWNVYAEYQTTVVYEDWPGSALQNAIRLNVSYTVPM